MYGKWVSLNTFLNVLSNFSSALIQNEELLCELSAFFKCALNQNYWLNNFSSWLAPRSISSTMNELNCSVKKESLGEGLQQQVLLYFHLYYMPTLHPLPSLQSATLYWQQELSSLSSSLLSVYPPTGIRCDSCRNSDIGVLIVNIRSWMKTAIV